MTSSSSLDRFQEHQPVSGVLSHTPAPVSSDGIPLQNRSRTHHSRHRGSFRGIPFSTRQHHHMANVSPLLIYFFLCKSTLLNFQSLPFIHQRRWYLPTVDLLRKTKITRRVIRSWFDQTVVMVII